MAIPYYLRCVLNAHWAFLLYILRPKPTRRIWIIGGVRGELYSDNSKAFHQYLQHNHPRFEVHWIANLGSPAYADLQGKVIVKGSVENYLRFYQADVCVFSDTLNHDIAPISYLLPVARFFYERVLKVRLNHGRISFKKKVRTGGVLQFLRDKILLSYDLSIAATPLEAKVLKEYSKPGSVVLAGSARDDQIDSSLPAKDTILVAPTWRTWLKNGSQFEKSLFYENYYGLLSSGELRAVLKKHSMTLEFYLHHLMFEHVGKFKAIEHDSLRVLGPDDPVAQRIVTSKLLITDYSSICAERYLLKRPVMFFQFDRDRYQAETGSYIDLENDKYGPVFLNTQELICAIDDAAEANFSISEEQSHGEAFFTYFKDKHNCERIFEAIMARKLNK